MDVSFTANGAIEWFHKTIRFGHGKDISRVFLGDAEKKDYIRGVILLAAFVIVFLFIWLAALLIFRCLGPKNVGFFSGQKMTQKERNFGDRKRLIKCRMAVFVRSLFTICAFNVLIFCGIAVTKGSFHLDNTIDSFQFSIMGVQELLDESLDVLDVLVNTAVETESLCHQAKDIFMDFCPIPNRKEVFGIDFNAKKTITSFEEIADVAIEQGKLAIPHITNVRQTLVKTDNILTLTTTLKELSAYYVLLISSLCATLISGTLLATSGYTSRDLERIQTRLLIPLLLLVSVIVWLSSSVFGTIGVVAGDFCLGGKDETSPDNSIYEILKFLKLNEIHNDLDNFIKFYIEGCNAKDPMLIVRSYLPIISDTESKVSQFLSSVDETGLNKISEICMHDVTEGVKIVRDLKDIINKAEAQAVQSISIAECPRINSIYVEAIHNGVCTSLPWATLWIFFSLLVIGLNGMAMVTLRSSILEHSKVFSFLRQHSTFDDDDDYNDTDFDAVVGTCADNESVMVQHDTVHNDRDIGNFTTQRVQTSEHLKVLTFDGNLSTVDNSGGTDTDDVIVNSSVRDSNVFEHDFLDNECRNNNCMLRDGNVVEIAAFGDATDINALNGYRNDHEYSAKQHEHMNCDCEKDDFNLVDKDRRNSSSLDDIANINNVSCVDDVCDHDIFCAGRDNAISSNDGINQRNESAISSRHLQTSIPNDDIVKI